MILKQRNKIKKRNKGSHIGVVISFIIFVTFILFFYTLLQPTLKIQEKQNFLESLKAKIIEESSAELKTASVKINEAYKDEKCIRLNDFLKTTGMDEGDKKIIVKDNDGKNLFIEKSGNNLNVELNEETFFRVYESEEIEESLKSLSGCETLDENTGYNIGLLKTSKEIFESKIINLTNEKYESLKNRLGILPGNEFGFDFTYSDGKSVSIGEEGMQGVSVYVDKTQIQYIKRDASREIGFLSVRVW